MLPAVSPGSLFVVLLITIVFYVDIGFDRDIGGTVTVFPYLMVLAMMIVDIIGESKLNNIFLRQLEESG